MKDSFRQICHLLKQAFAFIEASSGYKTETIKINKNWNNKKLKQITALTTKQVSYIKMT